MPMLNLLNCSGMDFKTSAESVKMILVNTTPLTNQKPMLSLSDFFGCYSWSHVEIHKGCSYQNKVYGRWSSLIYIYEIPWSVSIRRGRGSSPESRAYCIQWRKTLNMKTIPKRRVSPRRERLRDGKGRNQNELTGENRCWSNRTKNTNRFGHY